MGEPFGSGKRGWEGKGEVGGQYTSNLGSEWTGIAPHAKEGFQVSERGQGQGGLSRQGRLPRELSRELFHVLPI